MMINPLSAISAQDSTKIDSTSSVTPLKSHGSLELFENKSLYSKVSKQSLPTINYTGINEIIEQAIPIYPLNTGAYGEFNSFSAFGAMPNQIKANYNGRTISNRFAQSYDLSEFSPEFLERIELLTGSDAVISEDNSAGLLINFQEIIYNTKSPYTKLWYSQAGGDFLSADGIFSQNISHSLNIFTGFRSQSAKNLYQNSEYESWNVRGGIRWNPNPRTSLSLVENFTNHYIQNNGGIDKNTSEFVFDDLSAQAIFKDAKSQELKHDLTATLTTILDKDSTQAIRANAYFSHSSWENRLDSNMIISQSSANKNQFFDDVYFGAKAVYQSQINSALSVNIGTEAQIYNTQSAVDRLKNDGIKYSAFGRGKLAFANNLNISGGASFTSYEGKLYAAGGLKFSINKAIMQETTETGIIDKGKISYTADASYSETLPSDFTLFLPKKEQNILALMDFKYSNSSFFVLINSYYRLINNAIIYTNTHSDGSKINLSASQVNNSSHIGGTFAIGTELFKKINVKLWNMSQYARINDDKSDAFPLFYSGIDANYSQTVGRSEFTIGFDWAFQSKSKPMKYFSMQNAYVQSDDTQSASHNGLNLYATARLGTAFVKISLMNVLNSEYYTLSLYPMPGRNLRFSIHWDFFD